MVMNEAWCDLCVRRSPLSVLAGPGVAREHENTLACACHDACEFDGTQCLFRISDLT